MVFRARRMMRRVARRTARRTVRRQTKASTPGAPDPPPTVLIAGEGSSPPIKLTEADAKKIQEHTELPPEQLEDADLRQAMQELNIQSLPLTAEDQAALGQPASAPPAAAPAAPAAAPPPAAPGQASLADQLQQLAKLRDQGLISPADYDAKKKQLLGL